MLLRLQKYLADCGVASRRKSEEYITSGLVKVNKHVVTELGCKVDPEKDTISYNGKKITTQQSLYLILNKPKDYITTRSDPGQRKTIYALLPSSYHHLHPMGRLDRQTTGLLLLTNDGELTQHLAHPRHHIPKTYRLLININLKEKDFIALETGVLLEGKLTRPAKVSFLEGDPRHIEITIKEGRNRQIRNMFELLGYEVLRLKRTQIGTITLGKLALVKYRLLTPREIERLKKWQDHT
ncbi:MAG: pseudouridine synthase [Candidatus Margulisiibacteriota bacterium]